ncbi:MAG: EamA family transporter [Collinsella sp.]|nr:EamA family transporter [Collinsella sp.]
MANRFVLNTISYHGSGAIKEIPGELQRRGYKKIFVCSDPDLVKFGVTAKVTDELDAAGIEALAVFVVIGSFFAYMLYMQGVKDIGSVRASLIGTVEPVSATITSAVMLGTVFLPTDLIGFVMIIVMMFLTV